ncbi:MAG: DUF423 domain-containing protein [Crocinitomicaceae bacterium]|nr:DUF423 domain-containing protein [Crocinitomicaceae bacterium]
MNKKVVITGAVLIMLAVILGAFGAHSLKEVISEKSLASYEVGVRYQIYHGLALLIIGFSSDKLSFDLKWAHRIMLTGVLLFSCSIYLLSIQSLLGVELNFLGPVTPLGGVLIIASWVILIKNLLSQKK